MKKKIINLFSVTFMIMLSFNFANAQFDCTVLESEENQEGQESQEGTTDPYVGPMYVKLALHIFRNDDGSGGLTNEQLEETFDVIESIYAPHDIYFNYCIDEIHDSEMMVAAAFQSGFTKPLNQSDRIDAYIHFAAAGGYSYVPSKWFVASAKPHTIAHELGHALGITHTFAGGCYEDAPYEDATGFHYGENSYTAGDGVYDTPADLQDGTGSGTANSCDNTTYVDDNCIFQNPNNQVDSKDHKYRDIEYPANSGNWNLAHNIMNYYSGCHTLITAGQEERIRKKMNSSYMSQVIQDNNPKIKEFNYDMKINDFTLWDDDRIINGDVHVLGGTLRLYKNSIYFTPGHKIFLHAGSFLNSFYATIDVVNGLNNCSGPFSGETWGGIEIMDYIDGQSDTEIKLKLNQIRNAETAIYSRNPSSIIDIWATRFTDNHRAIEVSDLGQGTVNISNSSFIYNGPSHFSEHISQLKFIESYASLRSINVKNTNTSVTGDKFYGIDIYNSHINISNSTIKGWKNGISKLCGKRYTFLDIYNCIIEDNYANGIYTKYNVDVLNVKKSNLDNNGENGMFFDEDTYSIFDISNNDISNSNTGIKQKIRWNKWHNNTLFYNNNFYDLAHKGIDFKNSFYEEDGPLFLCNKMENTTGKHIYTEYAINPLQWGFESEIDEIYSAGNTFVSIPGMNFEAKYLPYSVNYFFDPMIPKEDPVNYAGINKADPFFVNPAECPDNPFGGGGNGGPGGPPIDWVDVIDSVLIVQDSIETVIDDWTDGGPMNDVITTITTVTSATADDVTIILTELGPWLSEESAEVLIQYADEFTSSQLVSIFAANPDLFMNTIVYNFTFGEYSPFSIAEQSVLNVASQQITDKTKLLVQLRDVKLNKEYIITQGVKSSLFATDSTVAVDFDKLRMWMAKRGDYSSKLGIADSYISEGNYSNAISYLQGISSTQDLSQEQSEDLNRYIELDQLLIDAYQNQRHIDELNSTELVMLENIAYSNTMFADIKARSILEYFYGYIFEDEEEVESRSDKYKSSKNVNIKQNSDINIFPNPNKGEFEVQLQNVNSEILIQNIKILTLDGKVVENRYFNSNKVKLKLENIQSGIFIFNITDTSGKLHTGKLIIK